MRSQTLSNSLATTTEMAPKPGSTQGRKHRSPLQDGTNKANASPSPHSGVKPHDRESRVKKTCLQVPLTPTPPVPASPSRIPVPKPLGPRALSVRDDNRDARLAKRPHSSMGFDGSRVFEDNLVDDHSAFCESGKEFCDVKFSINRSPTAPTGRHRHNPPSQRRPQSVLSSSPIRAGEQIHQRSPRWTVPPPATNVTTNLRIKTHVGPWKLGRTIGKGTTSRVRVAEHSTSGVAAAIKIISKRDINSTSSDRTGVTTCKEKSRRKTLSYGVEREVVIMKLMEHPNIIELLDVWESKGELFLILEYASAGSLFTYLSTHGALPEPEAMRFFRQIIGAVSSIHSYNICHRDLKPENILLDEHMSVKLADFGMAAFQPDGVMLTTSCGSPHYAAPEVIAGKSYRGDKADIWSCGVILFAMLAGYLPFDSGDVDLTLSLVCAGDYVIPPWFGRAARNLVQGMLRKRPADRLTSKDILRHPALRKYQREHRRLFPELEDLVYGDELLGMELPDKKGEMLPAEPEEVDQDIFTAMTVLWQNADQTSLLDNLLNDEVNYEKLFYKGLLDYRTEQLKQNEEYLRRLSANAVKSEDMPMLTLPLSSPSPQCPQISQTAVKQAKPQLYGPRPGPASPTEQRTQLAKLDQQQQLRPAKTISRSEHIPVVPSYDPYRASRMKLIDPDKVEHMKVTVYPPRMEVASQSRYYTGAAMRAGRAGLAKSLSGKRLSPSRSASGCARTAGSVKAKRNVSFQHVRDMSNSIRKLSQEHELQTTVANAPARGTADPTPQKAINTEHSRQTASPQAPLTPESMACHNNESSDSPTLPSPSQASLPTGSPTYDQPQLRRGNVASELCVRRKRVRVGANATNFITPSSTPMNAETPCRARQKQFDLLHDARKASREIELLCEEAFNRAHKQSGFNQPGTESSDGTRTEVVSSAPASGAAVDGSDSAQGRAAAPGAQNCFLDGQAAMECKRVRRRDLADGNASSSGDQETRPAISSASDYDRSGEDNGVGGSDSQEQREQQSSASSDIKQILDRQKAVTQSKRSKAWSSLEAALKSLETLCPEAPVPAVHPQHPSLAPPSPTIEQLKRTQEQLSASRMESDSDQSDTAFREIQARLAYEIALLEEKQRILDAADVESEEKSREEEVRAGDDALTDGEDTSKWNANLARLARRADSTVFPKLSATEEQDEARLPVSQQAIEHDGVQSAHDDCSIIEGELEGVFNTDLGVKPLSIRKKGDSLSDNKDSDNDASCSQKQTQSLNRDEVDASHNDLQESEAKKAIPPALPRKSRTLPYTKRRRFHSKLEPIVERSSSNGSSRVARKASEKRNWSWSKHDDSSKKQADKVGESGLSPKLPTVKEGSSDGKASDGPVSQARSRSMRFKSLFTRRSSKTAHKTTHVSPDASSSTTTATTTISQEATPSTSTGSGETSERFDLPGVCQTPNIDRHSVPVRQSSKGRTWSRLSRQLFPSRPETRAVALQVDLEKSCKAVRRILRRWKSYGFGELQFDSGGVALSGIIQKENSFNLSPLTFSGRFVAVNEATPRSNAAAIERCLLLLKYESGALSSFHKVADALEKSLRERGGLLVSDEQEVKEMLRLLE